MRYLLDTNIILRLANKDATEHLLVNEATSRLLARNDTLLIAPQCIYEFWSVATRPTKVNGLEFSIGKTRAEIDTLLNLFPLLPDNPRIFTEWLELVTKYNVSGKQVHDARLAATAKAHGVENLLTLNVDDFKRFDLKATHPSEVVRE
jgi:predicted nucleic acid-binding protein